MPEVSTTGAHTTQERRGNRKSCSIAVTVSLCSSLLATGSLRQFLDLSTDDSEHYHKVNWKTPLNVP